MKVSYNWLKELVNIKVSPKTLSDEMSLYSVEVESFSELVGVKGLVIGHVETCEMHPNSDHLHICTVNVGTDVRQIVCGAPNVAAGEKVIVAMPGCKLPGGEIKESKVRGVESRGMLCSLQELGVENKYVEAQYQNGIYLLPSSAPIGEDAVEYLQYNDYVIELGLTPNRMDLLSMLGVANDVNAMYNTGLKPLEYTFEESEKLASSEIDVEVLTTTCYAYNARVVENIKIKESPQFIKARLIASGIRPINNVVDITNYVLMLFGQPLHAFDKAKLGKKIVVRRAKDDEVTTTLDDIERKLNHHDIVITDNIDPSAEDTRVVCIAGVMGCSNTEVTDDTTSVVLESAVFRPLSVRRTSSKLGLRSESSVRFERGVDVNRTKAAVDYACYLLTKYADATVLKGTVSKGTAYIEPRPFKITEQYVEDYLGIHISKEEINAIFKRLSFESEIINNEVLVKVPNRRLDITIPQDLVEEIARIHGYNKLNETLPKMSVSGALTPVQKIRKNILHTLSTLGLNEVITYSLVNPKEAEQFKVLYNDECKPISLIYPITEEHSVLRRTLIPSLINVAAYNNARKISDLTIFEIGKRYFKLENENVEQTCVSGYLSGLVNSTLWKNETEQVDFFYVKGILEEMFRNINIEVKYQTLENPSPELHPSRSASILYKGKQIGFVAALHPKTIKENDLTNGYVFEIILDEIFNKEQEVIRYKQITKFPSVERDFAFVMDINQPVGEVIDAIYSSDKQCIKSVEVFDVYIGEKIDPTKKSVAFRIVMESNEQLTDEIINNKVKRLLNGLKYRYNIELRQ